MIQDQVSSWGSQSQSGGLLKRWNNSALSKALLVPWLFVSVGGLAVCHSWLHRHGLNLVVLLGLPPAALPPIRLSNSGGPPPPWRRQQPPALGWSPPNSLAQRPRCWLQQPPTIQASPFLVPPQNSSEFQDLLYGLYDHEHVYTVFHTKNSTSEMVTAT